MSMNSTEDRIVRARRQVQEDEWRMVRQIETVEDLLRHRLTAEAEAAREVLGRLQHRLQAAHEQLRTTQEQQQRA
jgi:hypothetical protein